ncbi:hypothetical protein PANT111_170174 [Pantoea brenneri]|uniref:Uncharacterized protein n=1 Tax=Pantoea brenneri TaxID=472694 RepID=A0AAX3J5D3_9GAMM|nr:hypothetical protein [Pantoea brenneri]VXB74637.1 hypothetical protein PANT111_170174 [Pantoea brenneri]
MNKLTAEKCRERIASLKRNRRVFGLALDSEIYLQALEIALPILEQQDRGEGSDDTFIVMRNPGKVPFIKRPTCDVAEYLVQLYQHNPEAVCEVITYRYAGASGQWVQDGRELLAELDIGVPAAMQGRGEGEWIEWGGGVMPVSGRVMVEVRFKRCSFLRKAKAKQLDWTHYGNISDIIAYRIIPERATNQNGEQ